MPFLELDGNADVAEKLRQLEGETIVGSGAQSTWRIQRLDLAARHFAVRVDVAGAATVAPATPRSVVILNGRQVPHEGVPLASGDVLCAGSARFVFLASKSAPRPAPVAAAQAYLIDSAGRKGYTLRRKVVQIGREIGCSIVLRDPSVSRFHADIRGEGGEHVLYSMGATGTKINGAPASEPRVLQEGDQIHVGATSFVFTRSRLPDGIKPTDFEDHADDSINRRATQVYQKAVTGAGPSVKKRGIAAAANPLMIGAIALSVLVIGVLGYMLLR